MWHVYILRCRDNSLYIGTTVDVVKRLKAHLAGKGGAYTQSHPPVQVVYQEVVRTRSQALVREVQLKKLTKAQKEQLIGDKITSHGSE